MNNQQDAFDKLSKLKVGALFMEMGTGKTKVALDLMAFKSDKVSYLLWVCPYSIKHEIELERNKWHPELDLEIIGVESLSQSPRIYLDTLSKVSSKASFVVVDESLKIKNKDALRTKRVLEIGKYAKYKLILNGTPLSRNVLDLYTQMEFLSPKILNMSFREYKNKYCEYYLRGRMKNLVKKQYNIEHLISLIKPYIYDCELELNSLKHYTNIHYELENWDEYNSIKSEMLMRYANTSQFDFMSMFTMMQKCYSKGIYKDIEFQNLINKIDGKCIVFVKYLDNIPSNSLKITGEIKGKDRAMIINEFKINKEKLLFITYGCGSYGLNLQFCNNIIFYDLTFNYAEKLQAEARIYRIGQSQDVHYYNLICKCGLEKIVVKSLEKKTNLLDEVKQEIEKVGAENWVRSI